MSKFKIGDRVVYHKGQSDEDTGTITAKEEEAVWWIKWDSDGDDLTICESNLEIIIEKTYSLNLINEYIKTRVGMYEIDQTIFDTWFQTKQTRLESLKESVVKMQQEISALEAQLK